MGERRLRILEATLPDGAFILGVDSHTALVLDLEAGTATVSGLGGVTVRVAGRSAVFPSGTRGGDRGARRGGAGARGRPGSRTSAGSPCDGRRAGRGRGGRGGRLAAPLRDEMAELEGVVHRGPRPRRHPDRRRGAPGPGLGDRRPRSAAARTAPTSTTPSATFRALIVRLGERAAAGARDPREALEPFVDALLELRARARAARDWETADLVRDRLAAAGVEVRDGPDGSTWVLAGTPEG